jgi:glyoxylase-like metal-dependent hydrolase (beta-lactamase superfamily II)
MSLTKHSLVVGPLQCNCSILVCSETREAVVIDPGDELESIRALCEREKVKLRYALHTHAHFDHIGATGGLKAWAPAMKIALHKGDDDLYRNLPMQGRLFGFQFDAPPPVDHFVADEETITWGAGNKLSVIHTPGHSPGGICFRCDAGRLGHEPVVFSGDTLFQSSVGRTDLWGGDHRQLVKSIRERLLTLDEQTQVFPGHGPPTSIGVEARDNPFL